MCYAYTGFIRFPGDSYDQNDLAPDTILSSSVYHIPHVIEVAFKTVADGTFEGGIYQLGMAASTSQQE